MLWSATSRHSIDGGNLEIRLGKVSGYIAVQIIGMMLEDFRNTLLIFPRDDHACTMSFYRISNRTSMMQRTKHILFLIPQV